MAKSLFQLVLDFVGDHQKIFKLESVTALPWHIQEKFLPYLSAHDLYEMSSRDPNYTSRKVLDHTWNLHVQRRWSRSQIVMNIFHESGFNDNPKLVYLQKYFWEILSYCSINLNTVDPISLFHCPLHKMNKPWPSDAIVKNSKELTMHLNDLMKFSIYAETLTIIGSQCSWICGNQNLLSALKCATKILQIQAVNDTYFESIKFLLQTLINQGKVTHAVFSMVRLTKENLSDLMQICAGIKFENNGDQDAEYKTNTLKLENLNKEPVSDISIEVCDVDCIPSTSKSGTSPHLNTPTIISHSKSPEYHSACPELDQYCMDLEIESQEYYSDENGDKNVAQDEIDLFDEAITPIPSKEPLINRGIYSLDGSYMKFKGLNTFAMLNTHSHCKEDFENVLIEVLPHWTSLTKFAIFDTDSESEELVTQIVKKLENHQLTHLVIDDANVHQTFFERLLLTFKDHYRISGRESCSHKPLQLLDFQACLKSLSADNLIPFDGAVCGIQKLDLSMTTILDSGFSLLLELLKNDRALKHLKLNGCFLKEDQVVQLLSVLSEKCQIETLGLSGNRVREEEVETQLLKFITNNKGLHTLILNYSRLRCQFVESEQFIDGVMSHPSLKELSIKNNHLKDTVCKLLKMVCCSHKPCALKNLNIGYNWVKGSDLVETAEDIVAYRKSHHMAGHVLEFLCLSGNRLHLSDNSQRQLWTVFDGIVKDLEVDRIDYDRPFNEHLAQM